jgi:hypothetical protein
MEVLRLGGGAVLNSVAQYWYRDVYYLALDEPKTSFADAKAIFERLGTKDKNRVYAKVYELRKRDDPSIYGWGWGERHVFDDEKVFCRSMHRLGLLVAKEDVQSLYVLQNGLNFDFGEGGALGGAQYFSFSERAQQEPPGGQGN